VLAMAFCHRELYNPCPKGFWLIVAERSLRHNAATSTPQACTPQKFRSRARLSAIN
jgi:hypothetical protein